MTKIAIFDVCDTLYSVNTTFSFLDKFFFDDKKYLFYRKISKIFLVKLINYIIYRILKIDLIKICGTFFLKGKSYKQIEKFTFKFVNEELEGEIKTVISSKINFFKERGFRIVLMSGSYDFIIKEVADYFNINEFYASKLRVIDGVFTGKYDIDILDNKIDLLKNNYKKIDKLVVISNNKSDLALMKSADQAYAVCNKEKDLKFWKPHYKIECIKDY